MSVPVTFPRNLPTKNIPHLNDDYLSLDGFLDDVSTETYEVAIVSAASWPPATVVWTTNPGVKTPTVLGRYVVLMRFVGATKPVACVGFLNVF